MSDDLNTINANRAKVFGREVEVLRKRYLQHRETLGRLTADAPTEHLAHEYARLQTEIDAAMAKIDELERGGETIAAETTQRAGLPPPPPPRPLTQAGPPPTGERRAWQTAPIAAEPIVAEPVDKGAGLRSIGIIAAGFVVLGVIGLLVWYFLSAEKPPSALRDKPDVSTSPVITETQAPAPPVQAASLSAAPADFNYGTIRKGTRATHQFTLANGTDSPITIATSRSTCKCLWFKHAPSIPPHGTTSLTITVDGARAKKGAVDEQVQVSAKGNAQATAAIHVVANVE